MSEDCKDFFKKQTDASSVKAKIVSDYFFGWSNVMARQAFDNIHYLDLFSGPGRYEDGQPSTPLLVLDKAINHFCADVRKKTFFTFNDDVKDFTDQLKIEIKTQPGIKKITNYPEVYNDQIDESTLKLFEGPQIPTLSFVDPCGYKGLSLPLITTLAKDWGSDCIFFFNYRRVNPAIDNTLLEKPISVLFSDEILEELRAELEGKGPRTRESIIINKIKQVFQDWGINYVITFPFKTESGARTSHYLIFVTKHILGYNIMKQIMGKASSSSIQGVPSFEYNPIDSKPRQIGIFDIGNQPLDKLKKQLLKNYAGAELSFEDIFSGHNVDTPYLKKNYRTALLQLEKEEKIATNRETRKARKGSFPEDMIARFPG